MIHLVSSCWCVVLSSNGNTAHYPESQAGIRGCVIPVGMKGERRSGRITAEMTSPEQDWAAEVCKELLKNNNHSVHTSI